MPAPNKRTDYVILLSCVVTTLAVLLFDLLTPLGVAGGVPYILVILLSMRSRHSAAPILAAVTCTTLTGAGFILSPPGGELWVVVSNRLLAVAAIWITAVLCRAVLRKVRSDIRTLEGLLPICASCKTIRDDQGNWTSIESFIQHRSEAKFTHGLCPACYVDLRPEYVAEPAAKTPQAETP